MSEPGIRPKRRSGSQNRRRANVVKITFDDLEFAVTVEKSRSCGLSLAAFGRASILGHPGRRSQRLPHPDAELLGHTTIQLQRVGNNLNQLLQILHGANAPEATEVSSVLAEIRALVVRICDIVGR